MSQPSRRFAVIFDRDGVLNVDHGYAYEPEKLEWMPGARAAVARPATPSAQEKSS